MANFYGVNSPTMADFKLSMGFTKYGDGKKCAHLYTTFPPHRVDVNNLKSMDNLTME